MLMRNSIALLFILAFFVQGCCSINQSKPVSLNKAIQDVHQAIIAAQAADQDTGMMLAETHVTLTLATNDEGTVVQVLLPIRSCAGAQACNPISSNQIDFTFQNFLTIPSASVAGTYYEAKVNKHLSTVE